jgi:hypothetical protein
MQYEWWDRPLGPAGDRKRVRLGYGRHIFYVWFCVSIYYYLFPYLMRLIVFYTQNQHSDHPAWAPSPRPAQDLGPRSHFPQSPTNAVPGEETGHVILPEDRRSFPQSQPTHGDHHQNPYLGNRNKFIEGQITSVVFHPGRKKDWLPGVSLWCGPTLIVPWSYPVTVL